MPTNIIWFERLAYASLVLGLLVGALDFGTLSEVGLPATVIGIAVGSIALMSLLIWLIARRKQNWARWLFLTFFLLGLPFFLMNLPEESILDALLAVLQAILQGAALYLVFTGDAKAAFAATQFSLPDIPLPKSIGRFETLGYLGLILAVLAAPFELVRITTELQGTAAAIRAGRLGAAVGECVSIGIGWLLIWLIARRRNSRARSHSWLFVLSRRLSCHKRGRIAFLARTAEGAADHCLVGCGLFCFHQEAQPWFKSVSGVAPIEPGLQKVRIRVAAGRREIVALEHLTVERFKTVDVDERSAPMMADSEGNATRALARSGTLLLMADNGVPRPRVC